MDWKTTLAETSAHLDSFRVLHPDAGKGFTALHHGTMKAGALTAKEKEFIALAIGVSSRCADCIGFHVRAAIRLGATREEVVEAVGVAVMMGGGPAYMYVAKAMEAFDQLSA
ncbi:MAG: carboxymuconolactone decarboxylase family protein [Limimaricola sp.]|uniref:carboxymuconolactone decarboxylase family protein n=1 Tax=Limimaricola sp. TaxID=2211665 RepID=UPI001DE06B91|nr:carboxymuconolactone decarboxylase family protein [Limimaricola sp.]MBI1416694.1 carboxymuconolactone decarboxylase family protein [Limimaricola sp.]